MQNTVRLILAAVFSLGLLAGCSTTEEMPGMTAAEAISDAKAANAQAKASGFEWRDTGKMIASAEKALAAGNEDEAMKLANKAKKQAEDAVAQSKLENKKFMNSLSADALNNADSAMDASRNMAGKVSNYSVVRGDNLWNISGKSEVYANPYQWPLIYKTNRHKIKDADLIYPGQQFDIDQNASSSDIDAAVKHAKTRGAWTIGDVEQSDINYLNR